MISNLVAHLPKLRESFPESSTELAPRSPGFNVGSVIGRIPGSQESFQYCWVQLKTAAMVNG